MPGTETKYKINVSHKNHSLYSKYQTTPYMAKDETVLVRLFDKIGDATTQR